MGNFLLTNNWSEGWKPASYKDFGSSAAIKQQRSCAIFVAPWNIFPSLPQLFSTETFNRFRNIS